MDQSKIVTGTGSQVVVTASSTIAGSGAYSWEIVKDQPGDPDIASLPSSPDPCGGGASCAVTVTAGAAGGKATLRAHFKAGTSDLTADTRIIVVQFTSVVASVTSHVDADLTKPFPVSIPLGTLQWPATVWAGGTPMVLVRGSLQSIAFQAFTFPLNGDSDVLSAVAFDVRRAPDDTPAVGSTTDLPTLDQTSSLGGTTLALDQTGSFQVLAFVDTNHNGKWDSGETGLGLPLILVQATLHRNLTTSLNPPVTYSVMPDPSNPSIAWLNSKVSAGDNTSVDKFAIVLAAETDLAGGGPDGNRGTDQVFGGWVQDILSPDVVGTYQNSHQDIEVFASNISAVQYPPYFLPSLQPSDPTPQLLAGPLIDSLNDAPASCGNSSLLPGSQQGLPIERLAPLNISPDPPPGIGKRVLFTAPDDPNDFFPAQHPIPGNRLTAIQFNLDFVSYLALWSSVTGTPDGLGTPPPNGSPGECTYRAVLQQPWSIRATFQNIDAQGAVQGASSSTMGPGQAVIYPPFMPITATPAILRPPTAQKSRAYNFQH
jgi:hypothetical protein